VSLNTIVHDGLATSLRRVQAAAQYPERTATSAGRLPISRFSISRLSISSMRLLETGLALSAIATALLIGQGR
jgi:hypothetical protein